MITVTYYEMTQNGNAIFSAKSSRAAWDVVFDMVGPFGDRKLDEYLVVEKTYEKEGEEVCLFDLREPNPNAGNKPVTSWCEVDNDVYYDMFG